MTDEVGRLVLTDNSDQNDLMGTSRANGPSLLNVHERQIIELEERRELNRELEALPSAKEIRRREEIGLGLTSPELATLLAHVKLALKDEVLASDVPDQEVFASRLPRLLFRPSCAITSPPGDPHTTNCGARSSPPCWSTMSSTPAASPSPTGSPRTPASATSTRCAPSRPVRPSSISARRGGGSGGR